MLTFACEHLFIVGLGLYPAYTSPAATTSGTQGT